MPDTSTSAAGDPVLGVHGTPSSGPCRPPQHCRGMQHCTCMGTLQHLSHMCLGTSWAAVPVRDAHTRTWTRVPMAALHTHRGRGRGLTRARTCTARGAHAASQHRQHRRPAPRLRQTSSGTQRPRGTHLHKQHSSSFPTARGARKQPHAHRCISSRLPALAVPGGNGL